MYITCREKVSQTKGTDISVPFVCSILRARIFCINLAEKV